MAKRKYKNDWGEEFVEFVNENQQVDVDWTLG